MSEPKRRSRLGTLIVAAFGVTWGMTAMWAAFQLIDHPIGWVNALGLHALAIGFVGLFSLGSR